MTPSDTAAWYAALSKPSFAPPAWVFGPVWALLYVLIAVSFGYVLLRVLSRRWPAGTSLPFLINLAANLLFTPLQFGLKSNVLALLDILVVLCTIPWMMHVAWNRARWVAYLQIPYLAWVSFATVLQISITWMNW